MGNITRRDLMKYSLTGLCSIIGLNSVLGCKQKDNKKIFYIAENPDFVTNLGIKVFAPSWIEKADYPELIQIIDKYDLDFHENLGEQISSDEFTLVIPDRIDSFRTSYSSSGCARGLFEPNKNTINVAWGRSDFTGTPVPGMPYPKRKNILTAFPHELSHKWLRSKGFSDNHNDFPAYILEADYYSMSQSPEFLGSFMLFNPDLHSSDCQQTFFFF